MKLTGGYLVGGGLTLYSLQDENLTLKEANTAVYITQRIGTSKVKLPFARDCAGQFVYADLLDAGVTGVHESTVTGTARIVTQGSDRILVKAATEATYFDLDEDRGSILLFSDGQLWFEVVSNP